MRTNEIIQTLFSHKTDNVSCNECLKNYEVINILEGCGPLGNTGGRVEGRKDTKKRKAKIKIKKEKSDGFKNCREEENIDS